MAFALPTHLNFSPLQTPTDVRDLVRVSIITLRPHASSSSPLHRLRRTFTPKLRSYRRLLTTNACGDGGGAVDATPQHSTFSDVAAETSSSPFGDSHVALFVRMLGLDYDPLDREQAVVTLWRYSLGGKQYVDEIMGFRGSINLIINLLKSESTAACEAAAGLLCNISTVNEYRHLVADSGAIEEITALLTHPSLDPNVKEQSMRVLWNLSVDEELRVKIVNSDLLLLLIKYLDDEQMKTKEAATGVLANLALTPSNHEIMVEAGVIPKVAMLLKMKDEGSEPVKKLAKSVLLEFAKDEYYKILVMEEGLVLVPLIGASAYSSFKSQTNPWPSLADGTPLKKTFTGKSKYGAGEVLLGLNMEENSSKLDEAKLNALEGRGRQQFLVRLGIIEFEDQNPVGSDDDSSLLTQRRTVLPWIDGVARLVLILGLEDRSAVARAAEAIADASISEHMRLSFMEAGAVKILIRLLEDSSPDVVFSAIRALDRLSISSEVCTRIEDDGVLSPLINSLKRSKISDSMTDLALNILVRVLDPSKEMKSKYVDESSNEAVAQYVIDDLYATVKSSRNVKDVLDSEFLARLIEILKTSSPMLQRKAASILEFATVADSSNVDKIISLDIESGLDSVFKQKIVTESTESDVYSEQPELYALELEEAGLAISAASRLLTRLLDSPKFSSSRFTMGLRRILKSNISLDHKDYVAACLVKLSSLSGPNLDFEYPIHAEVTIYETIPRLLEQIKSPSSVAPEVQEAAVVELNRIISEGGASRDVVAAEGGIFALVKLLERGSERGVEAALAVLYNLSMDAENHSAIIAAGAVPALKRIVVSQRPHWTRALHLLRTLPT
jgi:hypothetical protein